MKRVFQSVFQPRIEVSVKASLKHRLDTNDESDTDFKDEFKGALRNAVAFTVSILCSVLRESYIRNQFDLTKHLLPSDPELQKVFIEYLELNYGILETDVFTMMEDVQKKLFENVPQVPLPSWKLRITKGSEGFHLEKM